MILWSIEPIDKIFPTEIPETATMSINGGYLEGHMTPEGFAVSRLVSTDLKNYLRTEYSPGSIHRM